MAFGHFLLGSHNFMVTALGSCVKWPLYNKLTIPFKSYEEKMIKNQSKPCIHHNFLVRHLSLDPL